MAASPRHRLRSLLWELKRRRVFRVAAIYVVAAFAVLQAADILVPALHLPAWTMTLLVVLVLVGSPVVVALAWAFDIVPGGTERTPSTDEMDARGEADSSRQTTDNRNAAVATARVARAPEPIAAIPATPSPRVWPRGKSSSPGTMTGNRGRSVSARGCAPR